MSSRESGPLLPQSNDEPAQTSQRKPFISTGLIVGLLIAACLFVGIRGERPFLPKGDLAKANYYLSKYPVIDGHIDLPELARVLYSNDVNKFDLHKPTEGHLDIPRLRKGKLGGFFWSV